MTKQAPVAPAGKSAQPRKSGRVPPLASLAHRDFRLLMLGIPFSQTGLQMRNAANAWQVYQLTGSSVLLGLTFLFQGAPSMLMGLFGGTLADIFDRRLLIKITVTLQALLAVFLGFLTITHIIQVWHIYAITFTAAAVGQLEGPSRSALIPKLVPQEHLVNAAAMQSTLGRLAQLMGPLLAGVIIKVMGAAWAYFLNAALMVPAIIFIIMLHVPDTVRRKVKLNVAAIFEGLTFVLKTRVLFALLILDMLTMVLGYYPAMMPVFAETILKVDSLGLGLLLAAAPFGGIVGFVVLISIGNIQRKGATYLVVIGLHAVVLMAFAFSPWFLVSLVLVALLGFLDAISVAIRQVSFQILAPDEARGRVMSMIGIFAVSSNSMGGAWLGLMTGVVGAQIALGMGGVIAGACTIFITLAWTSVRKFRTA